MSAYNIYFQAKIRKFSFHCPKHINIFSCENCSYGLENEFETAKFGDYLPGQAHKPCSISYLYHPCKNLKLYHNIFLNEQGLH